MKIQTLIIILSFRGEKSAVICRYHRKMIRPLVSLTNTLVSVGRGLSKATQHLPVHQIYERKRKEERKKSCSRTERTDIRNYT
jgi:hypothetical protein